MTGGGLNGCGTSVPRGGSRKIVAAAKRKRKLSSRANGRFTTRGRNSSATLRGTAWDMTDTCKGTLTTVKQGSVTVRDFTLRKTKVLKRGQKYLARAPKKRK
jgi:ferric-dicitrate binding protein FerR (iron transport regulator)